MLTTNPRELARNGNGWEVDIFTIGYVMKLWLWNVARNCRSLGW